MCGIGGAVRRGRSPFTVERPFLDRMATTMAHRGPDGGGSWTTPDRGVGFAHRRLAIIDPTPEADQPMVSADGAISLVFNGEIYNHRELRRELEAEGCGPWRTDHSDTEVVLQAYARWGIGCIERFRGMFAIAVWDDRDGSLWLVRDRIGVKPLYYTVDGDRLLFASEIKAILTDPKVPRAVDESSLYHYLSFLTTPAPATLFEGISKLEPGTTLRLDRDGVITKRRWWDVWDHVEPMGGDEQQVADRLLARLEEAVELRKIADVPVGVFLSGGIDSSLNAVLFSRGEQEPLRTFSIGYAKEYPSHRNELDFARMVASDVGADHHELLLSVDDVVSFLPRMVELQDEPISDPVCVPVHYVSQLARDAGVVVCHVGEGSDELFCGYESWRGMLRLQSLDDRTGMRWAKGLLARGAASAGLTGWRAEYLQRAAAGRPVFWGGAESFTDASKQRLLSPRLRRDLDGLSSWDAIDPIRSRFLEKAWQPSPLHWMTYLDLSFRLPELLLMRVDKMSMGASIECRVPFLDHRFVEDVLSVDTAMKLAGGELKHLLKVGVRGVLPDSIIDRPKQGFGVPVHEYFFDQLGDVTRSELRSFCAETDLLDAGEVEARLTAGAGWDAWYLLNLAMWWKTYIR